MATDYERLRDAVQAEVDEPGAVTKAELRAVLELAARKPQDDYDDAAYDPDHYG